MKKVLRNITVEHINFVYWYSSGDSFILNISPQHDKTSKLTIEFKSQKPQEKPFTFWAFYELETVKKGLNTTINISMPKTVAELICFLLHENKYIFKTRFHYIIDNGMHVLEKMGYSNIKPVWIDEF